MYYSKVVQPGVANICCMLLSCTIMWCTLVHSYDVTMWYDCFLQARVQQSCVLFTLHTHLLRTPGRNPSCSLTNSWWRQCLPNGMDDNPISHRQPRLFSTSQARPASKQLPRVQKASSHMSQTPLPLVGMNSMYSVKDTGTPPRPRPTQKRKKINHCIWQQLAYTPDVAQTDSRQQSRPCRFVSRNCKR